MSQGSTPLPSNDSPRHSSILIPRGSLISTQNVSSATGTDVSSRLTNIFYYRTQEIIFCLQKLKLVLFQMATKSFH